VTLSEAANIGLHAMILVAKSPTGMNVLQISEVTKSSKHHVAKIMQRLVKENFLTSQRGPSGGFTLKKNPETISLLSIYEAIEGKIEVSNCALDKQVCPFDKCFMNNITQRMTNEFKNYLENQSLASYL
jgi:Rrf2 family protein